MLNLQYGLHSISKQERMLKMTDNDPPNISKELLFLHFKSYLLHLFVNINYLPTKILVQSEITIDPNGWRIRKSFQK